ncbi:hypothetical protein ACHWUR_00430 [Klebsiella pneumoniae]
MTGQAVRGYRQAALKLASAGSELQFRQARRDAGSRRSAGHGYQSPPAALVDHRDAVGALHRGQAMGDHPEG